MQPSTETINFEKKPMKHINSLLKHKSLTMTMRYAHLAPSSKQRAATHVGYQEEALRKPDADST